MARMTTAAAPDPLAGDLIAQLTDVLAPAGWQPVAGHPSLFLRSNTALMSALRCHVGGDGLTVASVSMMFEEDRPLQLTIPAAGRDTLLAICQVLNRHAGRLDRLDYADCVEELLRHVAEVRVEAESSGLVPMAARLAGGAVRYDKAPPPVWPPSEAARAELNERRGAGEAGLLPWEAAQYKQLPKLLAKDRRRSLSARLAYYQGRELTPLDDTTAFVRTVDGGRHAVCFPADDGNGAFAHSVGLAYLHDLPEILLVSPMPAMIGATSHALALIVDAIAAAMLGGVRIAPGDRYAVVAERVARAVGKRSAIDHASLADSRFVLPPARTAERTLGSAAWFYANFMDATSFPVLACLLQPPRVPPNYGQPPPPPPPRTKPIPARTAAVLARVSRAAAGRKPPPPARPKAKAKPRAEAKAKAQPKAKARTKAKTNADANAKANAKAKTKPKARRGRGRR